MSAQIILIVIFILAHAALLIGAMLMVRHYVVPRQLMAVIGITATGLLVTAFYLLPPEPVIAARLGRDFAIWLGLMAISVSVGYAILNDLMRPKAMPRQHQIWLGLHGIWAIGFILLASLNESAFVGWSQGMSQSSAMALWWGLAGLGLGGVLLLGWTFWHFYIAPMPELANRAAFWTVIAALFWISFVLLGGASLWLMIGGQVTLILASVGMIYGLRWHRLVDVRLMMLAGLRVVLTAFFTWSLTFGAMYAVNRLGIAPNLQGAVALAGIALLVALMVIPATLFTDWLIQQWLRRAETHFVRVAAEYGQSVAMASTIEEVVTATTETLNRVMGVKRTALILINNTFRVPDSIELVVLEAGSTSEAGSNTGYVHKQSPIFRTLAGEGVPLGYFDVEYGVAYRTISEGERNFFRRLGMWIYVPLITEGRLIGLLACGAKLNDTPYYRHDVEVLMVIAQQVSAALRGARLVDDLQNLNDNMRVLNKRLEGAKVELEKLDSVKSDFITIASHELRTPLAQIRGYTDILDSLNQQDILQKGQTTQMVASLRKSTERMEELISAMLDVSQLDVNAMDLRFVRTTPETIIRMAMDPLKEASEQRKITIMREGLTGLPHVQADMQRMVQAFRNLLVNAIKFTPDGGKITISAVYKPATESEVEHILFTVKDTGVGIAHKDVELIFQKFYRGFNTQLHSTGMYKFMGAGPGLGLTIAKGIVDGHGGKIWAESTGHDMKALPGSTFYIVLPVNPPKSAKRVLPFEGDTTAAEVRPAEIEALLGETTQKATQAPTGDTALPSGEGLKPS